MAVFIALPVAAAETESASTNFGGPDAVPNQIESDALDALMGWGTAQGERWDAWKKNLAAKHGLGLGIDYTAVYLNASSTLPGERETLPVLPATSHGMFVLPVD